MSSNKTVWNLYTLKEFNPFRDSGHHSGQPIMLSGSGLWLLVHERVPKNVRGLCFSVLSCTLGTLVTVWKQWESHNLICGIPFFYFWMYTFKLHMAPFGFRWSGPLNQYSTWMCLSLLKKKKCHSRRLPSPLDQFCSPCCCVNFFFLQEKHLMSWYYVNLFVLEINLNWGINSEIRFLWISVGKALFFFLSDGLLSGLCVLQLVLIHFLLSLAQFGLESARL